MAAAVANAVKKRNEADLQGRGDPQQIREQESEPDLPPADQRGIWRYQHDAARLYTHLKIQLFVAGLIGGNFLCNILEKWMDPRATIYTDLWAGADMFFNIMFTLELALNMYAFWCRRFWRSGWNVFDFIVVSIGLFNMFKVPLPGPLKLLRMMRAFRVFRLFKRVKSLNKIIQALLKAVPGVANAFLILTLVMSIYAILGVEFFLEFGADGSYTNEGGTVVPLETARGLRYGYEYWGNFGKALYTLFQVLTCESWSEMVARPMLHTSSLPLSAMVAIYFITFNIVVGIVLVNVAVAVLLEKMVDDGPSPKQAGEDDDYSRQAEVAQEVVDGLEKMLMEGQDKEGAMAVVGAPAGKGAGAGPIPSNGGHSMPFASFEPNYLELQGSSVLMPEHEMVFLETECESLKCQITSVKQQLDYIVESLQNVQPQHLQ
eukprot:TRINITY_DN110906_c0_g1_i1.p1 TRINITY_DN110906_c0_g1~~TRINITY_DN110906_c0_g1_i1.p1  ORF type:complete len:432 (-),score=94.67 TRINITY_DN110906_c0_g1_i1:261-1556(-)